MSTPPTKGVRLSGRLLNLRFMRQKTESDVRATLEKEQYEREKEAHWTTDIDLCDDGDGLPSVIIDESVIPHEYQKYFGRRSFGNFNPVVEKRNRAGLVLYPATSSKSAESASENRPVPVVAMNLSQNPPVHSSNAPISTDYHHAPVTETPSECPGPVPIMVSSASVPVSRTLSKSYALKQNPGKRALSNADSIVIRSTKKRRNFRRKKGNPA